VFFSNQSTTLILTHQFFNHIVGVNFYDGVFLFNPLSINDPVIRGKVKLFLILLKYLLINFVSCR